MDRWSLLLAAALVLLPVAWRAKADDEIALPLSRYGSLLPIPLETAGLPARTAHAVKAAISAARHGSRNAAAAEAIMRAAQEAGDKAGKIRGYEALDVPGADGTACLYRGRASHGHASGLGVMHCRTQDFAGRFRDGRLSGLGGDAALDTADAYEGSYRDGTRAGFGIERDKDGFYPGLYGFRAVPGGKKIAMEILGLQDFKIAHWAGGYGYYSGPKIACVLIKGAVLEGSVLDGYGAKFDARGHLMEQGFYRLGRPANGAGPPC